MIPANEAPPFVIITLTDDPDCGKNLTSLGKFVQLQKGVKKESYGDLLENYKEVKNFCDTIKLDDRFLELGDLDVCNLGSACKSNFPIKEFQKELPEDLEPAEEDLNTNDDEVVEEFPEDLESAYEDLEPADEDLNTNDEKVVEEFAEDLEPVDEEVTKEFPDDLESAYENLEPLVDEETAEEFLEDLEPAYENLNTAEEDLEELPEDLEELSED